MMGAQMLERLDAAAVTHAMPVPADGSDPDYLLLPDGPAVVVFEVAGATVLIATTASARDLARRRFGHVGPAGAEAPARGGRVDLRGVCAGGAVRAIRVGSSLEADAVYLRQARERLPLLARVVAERWRAWFVHVDWDAKHPHWTKTNLMVGLVGKRSASEMVGGGELAPGEVLGPLADKDAAGRLIEGVIDCFDLCRYHNILVQAPRATACAYKEMGRCPAPCDGSEELERYRNRVCAAATMINRGVAAHISAGTRAMEAAAGREDYERAAKEQKDIARLRTLDKPAFAQVRSFRAWSEVLVLPSATRGVATAALFDRGRLWRLGDVALGDVAAAERACRAAEAEVAARGGPGRDAALTLCGEGVDTIGVVSRWLLAPKSRRRGDVVMMVDSGFSAERLMQRTEALARSSGKAAPIIEDQQIEGG